MRGKTHSTSQTTSKERSLETGRKEGLCVENYWTLQPKTKCDVCSVASSAIVTLEASCFPDEVYTLWTSANSFSSFAALFRKPALVVVALGLGALIRGWITKSGRQDSSCTNPMGRKHIFLVSVLKFSIFESILLILSVACQVASFRIIDNVYLI